MPSFNVLIFIVNLSLKCSNFPFQKGNKEISKNFRKYTSITNCWLILSGFCDIHFYFLLNIIRASLCSYFFTQSELRCSYKECSYKKECIYIRSDAATRDVLENFSKFTGKHLYRSLFFNKVAGLRHRCFPVNFAKFSRTTLVAASVLTTPFLQNTAGWLLLLGVTFAIYR